VLRLVPQADLKILDTVQTTNNITSNHGYMVYDTLFALDSKFVPKPQMVESHTRSPTGSRGRSSFGRASSSTTARR
jgi:peptide/nickel transport system substrate-binding protein